MHSISNVYHGGSCCGIFHLRSFPHGTLNVAVEQWRTEIERNMRQQLFAGNANRLAEIVLKDAQAAANPNLLTAMGQLGFKPVSRFRNSNSGNVVTIFHRIEKALSLDDLPFVLGEPIQAVGYRRIYASGYKSKVYRTRAEAETYRGRAVVARIDEARMDTTRLF